MNKVLLLKLDHGNGYIGYYNRVSLQQLKEFITKRGCERLIFRLDQTTYEMSYKDFKEKYLKSFF